MFQCWQKQGNKDQKMGIFWRNSRDPKPPGGTGGATGDQKWGADDYSWKGTDISNSIWPCVLSTVQGYNESCPLFIHIDHTMLTRVLLPRKVSRAAGHIVTKGGFNIGTLYIQKLCFTRCFGAGPGHLVGTIYVKDDLSEYSSCRGHHFAGGR